MGECYGHLSYPERLSIMAWHDAGQSLREIARRLERHPSTISRELRRARLYRTARYDAICTAWANEPHRFRLDPVHLTSGLNT